MRTTPWRNLQHKLTPARRAAIQDEVCAELARLDMLKGQPTGDVCAGCGEPVRYGDAAAVNRAGRDFHERCA